MGINKLITVNCDSWLLADVENGRSLTCEGDWGDGFQTASEALATIKEHGWRVFCNGYVLCPACTKLQPSKVKWSPL